MDFGKLHLLSISLFSLVLVINIESLYSYTLPMNCTDTTRLCTSFLAYKMQPNQTLSVIQSMFDVVPEDVTVEGNGNNYIFVRKNCSCLSTTKNYVSNTTFTVKSNGGYVNDLVKNAYDGLEILDNNSRMARAGAVVSLRLFCGCSSGLWIYLMSYVMKDGDTVQSLASRFGVSMDSIEQVNGIVNPNNVTVGDLYYIPLNSGWFNLAPHFCFLREFYILSGRELFEFYIEICILVILNTFVLQDEFGMIFKNPMIWAGFCFMESRKSRGLSKFIPKRLKAK